jgi:hypothetical protein
VVGMRIIKSICAFLLICISFVTFYVVSNYYDSANDRFTFVDLNVVEANDHESDGKETTKPKISYSNVYNLKYKYYQLVGIYFVNGFLVSLLIVGMYQTKMFKIKASEFIEEADNLIILFMTSVSLGLVLAVTQAFIYNRLFIDKNNSNIQRETAAVIIQN